MTAHPSPDQFVPAAAEPAPTNRAARRGKGKRHVPDQARYQPTGHARPAQGRRVNPVRRTG